MKTKAWGYLITAGILEIVWAYYLDASHGFSKLQPSILAIIVIILSFYFLQKAFKSFDIGTAYAIFTGIGTAGTAIFGMLLLGESATPGKLVSLSLLFIGIIGLKLSEQTKEDK